MVNQAVNSGNGHAGIRKDAIPSREGLVGGNEQTAAFIAFGNQFKQHAGFGLVLDAVGDVVEDDQVEAVEFGQRGWQLQALASRLQFLHEFSGMCEQNPVTGVDQGMANGAPQMALADTRRAEDQHGGTALDPGIATRERRHMGLRQQWHDAEIKGCQGLGR